MDINWIIFTSLIVAIFILIFVVNKETEVPPGKPKTIRELIIKWIKDVKFNFNQPLKSIILPIITISIIYVFCNCFLQLHQIYDSIAEYTLISLVLAPLGEEIIQCLTLSFFHIYFSEQTENRNIIWSINAFVLILTSIMITLVHRAMYPVLIFFLFVVYGILYYFNDRNLIPPIIAHFLWNLLIIL